MHGLGKRRTWRKLHLVVDAGNHDIVARVARQIDGDLASVSADGAYDTKAVYEAIRNKKVKVLVPPRKAGENLDTWQYERGTT